MRAEKEGGVEDVFQILPLGIYKYMGIYLDFLCIYYVRVIQKGDSGGELPTEISTENIYVQVCSLQRQGF